LYRAAKVYGNLKLHFRSKKNRKEEKRMEKGKTEREIE